MPWQQQIDINIVESLGTLKKLLSKQTSISNKHRIKILLLAHQKKVNYTKDLLLRLKQGGLEFLLSTYRGGNNTPVIKHNIPKKHWRRNFRIFQPR